MSSRCNRRRLPLLLIHIAAGAALVGPFGLGASVAMAAPRMAPAAPTGLQAEIDTENRVSLSWVDNADSEQGFRLIREKMMGTSWRAAEGITLAPDTTTYTDDPGPGNYRYKLRAYNSRGNSSYTRAVLISVSSETTPTPPAAPGNLRVSNNDDGTATLVWDDLSQDETGFEVDRQPAFSGPLAVSANVNTTIDAPGAGQFSYRVRSVNAVGSSAYTDFMDVTITTPQGGGDGGGDPSGGDTGSGGSGGGTGTGGGGGTEGNGTFVVIPAGYGFMGTTPIPAAVGDPSSPGYDAKAIARWDVVPHQTITGEFNVSVVAFHINGIDRVEFSANGGAWVAANDMQWNPQNSVWEYTAKLRAADFPDGPIEVRAVVIPTIGAPRVLQGPMGANVKNGEYSLLLSSNNGRTLQEPVVWVDAALGNDSNPGTEASPVRTASMGMFRAWQAGGSGATGADGATVYLKPGNYTWGPAIQWTSTTSNRWVTLTAAPNVPRSQVVFNAKEGTDGFHTNLVCVRNVTFRGSGAAADCPFSTSQPQTGADTRKLWVDRCDVIGPGMHNGSAIGGGFSYLYATDSLAENWFRGFIFCEITRNCSANNMGEQPFMGSSLVVNGYARHLRFGTPEAHPNLYTYHGGDGQGGGWGNLDNVIIYGLQGYDIHGQVIHWNGNTQGADAWGNNLAIVNLLFEAPPGGSAYAQWENGQNNHLLVWNVSMPDSAWVWRDTPLAPAYNMRNVSVKNSVFFHVGTESFTIPTAWYDNNHFINVGTSNCTLTPGTRISTGSAGWIYGVSPNGNYRPAANSLLAGRVNEVLVPADTHNVSVLQPGAIGALQP